MAAAIRSPRAVALLQSAFPTSHVQPHLWLGIDGCADELPCGTCPKELLWQAVRQDPFDQRTSRQISPQQRAGQRTPGRAAFLVEAAQVVGDCCIRALMNREPAVGRAQCGGVSADRVLGLAAATSSEAASECAARGCVLGRALA